MALTIDEDKQLQFLLEQEALERVSPKLERFREDWRIKVVKGGRAAGAKSWGISSLLVQKATYQFARVCCLREVQKSLEESVHQLIIDQIDRLKYPNWEVKHDHIMNTKTGSKFIFRGLRDLRAAHQIKGLEGYTDFWLEEASVISEDSLRLLVPTIVRNEAAQLWISYNPESDMDPVTMRFWNTVRDDMLRVEVAPGRTDNPWWNDALQKEMELDYLRDPDEAEHVWGGQPRNQSEKTVMSRVLIRQAMQRTIDPLGGEALGCDPAYFGKDKTQIYHRHGLKVIDHREIKKSDGIYVARVMMDMARQRKDIPMKVDVTGIGASCVDHLRHNGMNVIPISFGSNAADRHKYANAITEMWFTFPLDEADIPEDPELMQELSQRQYDYDNKNRYIVESKDQFKKRIHRSPDKSDGLLLCYYEGKNIILSDERKKQLQDRWRK